MEKFSIGISRPATSVNKQVSIYSSLQHGWHLIGFIPAVPIKPQTLKTKVKAQNELEMLQRQQRMDELFGQPNTKRLRVYLHEYMLCLRQETLRHIWTHFLPLHKHSLYFKGHSLMSSKKRCPENSQDCKIMVGLTVLLMSGSPVRQDWCLDITTNPATLWVKLSHWAFFIKHLRVRLIVT